MADSVWTRAITNAICSAINTIVRHEVRNAVKKMEGKPTKSKRGSTQSRSRKKTLPKEEETKF